MEEKPWLKSEFFAWHDGRRIVDLYELSKQLQCKQCRSLLDLRRTERESRFGLASVLYIACHCGVMNDVHTGRKQETGSDMANNGSGGGNMYEINIKASINLLMYGVGASRFLSFLALLDIPVPPPDDTSLIVPVTDDSEMQRPVTGAPSSSALPPVPPAFGSSEQYSAPPRPYNIPPSEYSIPPPSQTSIPGQRAGSYQLPHTSTSSYGTGSAVDSDQVTPSDSTPLPHTASSTYVPGGETGVKERLKERLTKNAPSGSGDDQKVMYVPPLDEDDSETEPVAERRSSTKSKSSGVKRPTARRGRGRGRGRGGTRKTPAASATQTSARKKKRAESSDDDGFEEADNAPKCPDCAKIFTSIKGYNQHMKRVHNKEVKGEGSERKKSSEKSENNESLVGESSEQLTEQSSALKLTEISLDNSVQVEVNAVLYLCPHCPKSFLSFTSFGFHAKRSHKMQDLKDEGFGVMVKEIFEKFTTSFDDGQPCTFFRCLKCGKYFLQSHQAASHIRVGPDRNLLCASSCDNGKPLRPRICHHLLQERVDHLCPDCGAVFKYEDKQGFYRHTSVHTRTKKYACDKCPYRTCFLAYFKKHLNTHLAHRVRSHVCELCGKAYLDKRGLIDHRDRIHNKKDKDACHIQQTCKEQEVKETEEAVTDKVYVCAFCGQPFVRESSIPLHIQHKHGDNNLEGNRLDHTLEDVIVRNFHCVYYRCLKCGKEFVDQDKVAAHIRVDTAAKTIVCAKLAPRGQWLSIKQQKLLLDPGLPRVSLPQLWHAIHHSS
ncbi:hypothetical protein BaRGS_00013571 [Batillaria attramentaria]|uniref:C2H2-type domain-containing protein n=1 Tax=Batillaria attramentaria TaxID=370345 RepID=A0ABD0L6K3_9CAEN